MIRLSLAQDTIAQQDLDALAAWLKSGPRLSQGSLTVEFEQKWAKWLGVPHAVFCNSGSSANLLMFQALASSGRLKSKKVVAPAIAWPATVTPAMQLGFEPVLCEADAETFGLDLDCLEKLLKKHKPGVVIGAHVLGVPFKVDELLALKKKYGFVLLEDACAALGAEHGGRKCGSFGDMSSVSFYFGHQMSTIEGGMVSTSDEELAELCRMLRGHGWSKDLPEARRKALLKESGMESEHLPFVFHEAGFNVRSTDLNAFLGLRTLERLDAATAARRRHHARYTELLGPSFRIQKPAPESRPSPLAFGFLAADAAQRKAVLNALAAEGIETRVLSGGNLGRHPFWTKRYGRASFPLADRIHETGAFVPCHPSLTGKQVEEIAGVVTQAACARS